LRAAKMCACAYGPELTVRQTELCWTKWPKCSLFG